MKTMGSENCLVCEHECEKREIIEALIDIHGIDMDYIRVNIETCPLHEKEV